MTKRELLEFLKEIGVIKVIPEEEKSLPCKKTKTSSNQNVSIKNDNTQNEGCQEEIDYKSKYIKCSNLLCLTELRIKKIYQLLNNIWEDFASVDIDQSQFIGAACLKEMPPETEGQKAALRLLSEYDRLFDFINIALDYIYDIKKSFVENSKI